MASQENHLVFLYGSLKIGQPKEYIMKNKENGEAQFISKAITVEKWPLVVESQYGIPFLLGRQGRGKVTNMNSTKFVIPLHLISWKKTPNDTVAP